jgi:hypothetical protein
MRNRARTFLSASALVGGLAVAPALYAQDYLDLRGSTMGRGMMGGKNMMNMGQMSQMMDDCNQMMGTTRSPGSGRPNEQWRQPAPATPEKAPETPEKKG